MKFLLPLCLAALASLALPISASASSNTPIESAVAELGRVHGAALACKQPALVTRARNAIVTTAPKTRDIGETFENATNAAYLEQGKGKTPCPDGATLAGRISASEKRLQAAFPKAQ